MHLPEDQDEFDFDAHVQWLREHAEVNLSDYVVHFYPNNISKALATLAYLSGNGFPLSILPISATEAHPEHSPDAFRLSLGQFDWLNADEIMGHWQSLYPSTYGVGGVQSIFKTPSLSAVQTRAWVDSTQSWASQCLRKSPLIQLAQGRAFFAEYQSAGRGRMGRQWSAPFGSCLMHTLAISVPGSWMHQRLSPLLALFLCERLRAVTQLPVQVKWPNDLFLNGAKLAGCLIQSQGLSGQAQSDAVESSSVTLLVGLGVNLIAPQGLNMDKPVAHLWADMGLARVSKNELAAHLVDAIMHGLQSQESFNATQFRHRWHIHDAFADQQVVLALPNSVSIKGVNEGVDCLGQLQVRSKDGKRHALSVGEVSLSLK